jgi:GT2 family glycosyltransferase
MSEVDTIVVDIDGGAMLRDCLDSIRGQTVAPREVIVFDNGSRTPLQTAGVRILRSDRNLGFAGGVNEAFQHTRSDFIALINNDVVLDSDWLRTVKAALDSDPRLAAVQTIIRRDERTIDGAGIDISDGTFRQIGYGSAIDTPLAEAWGVSATATLYRRAALGERVFDARFFAYYEDAELSARLHESGWRTAVLPIVKATHRGSASASILGRTAVRLRTRNRYWVARLHPGVGRKSALFGEDLRLLLRGRSSVRGIIEGLCSRL